MKHIFFSVLLLFSFVSFAKSSIVIPKEKLMSLDDKEVSLFEEIKKGDILVLNFWAQWCSSCQEEIPDLNKLKKAFENQENIRFYAINAGDQEVKIKKFLKRNPFYFTILKDPEKKVSKALGVDSLPQTYIIKNSKIIYHKHIPPSIEELKQKIAE